MNKLFATVLILPLALASPVSAQADKTRVLHAEREVIEMMLLRQKSVREELKIDMENAKKIFEFTHKQHQRAMEVSQMPKEQQAAKWEEMEKENDEFLHKAITPEQHKRLKQIAMQTAGLLFCTGPKISKELNLTEEQKTECTKAQQETQQKVFAVMNAESREGRNEKLKEIREASRETLFKILTAEQKTKWKEYVGEPFKGHLVFEEKDKK
jgi:hypothetical protein